MGKLLIRIGDLYAKMEKMEEALEHYESAMKCLREGLGENHPYYLKMDAKVDQVKLNYQKKLWQDWKENSWLPYLMWWTTVGAIFGSVVKIIYVYSKK